MRDVIAAECSWLIHQHFLNDGGIAHVNDIGAPPAITRNSLLVRGARKALDVIAPERPQARKAPQWLRRRIERHEIAVRQHRTVSFGERPGLNARDLVASSGPSARHEDRAASRAALCYRKAQATSANESRVGSRRGPGFE